jgi:hypothetical protein
MAMEDKEYPFPDGVKLAIALPHTMSLISTVTHHSLFCVARPDRVEYLPAHPGGDLANRREYQIEEALKLQCTHIWLIDGDMDFPNDILIRLFKLLKQGADLAGGLCYRGYPPHEPIAKHPTKTGNMRPLIDFQFGDIIEPKGTGAACLLVKREVFEKVPRPWFSIFRDTKDPLKIVKSLDFHFTSRATELGFKLWIDTSEDVGHLKEIGINRDFYFMNEIFDKLAGPEQKTNRIHKLAQKLSEPSWINKLDQLLDDGSEIKSVHHGSNSESMNWKIISGDRSIFAQRLAGMLGLEILPRPEGSFDGLFFVDMLPENMAISQQYKTTPKICYWTGSDTRIFLNHGASSEFGPSIHVTDSPWLTIKLNARIPNVCFLPMPPDLPDLTIPIEANPGILMYLNKHPARDIERSLSFIRAIKDIPIYIIRGPGVGVGIPTQENVTDLKWIPDNKRGELFKKVSTHVRFMHYDGLSQTVIEMKMLGRHVFYTTHFPYCNYVDQEEKVEVTAQRVRETIQLPPDREGIEWYWSIFNRDNFSRILGDLCEKKGWGFPTRGEY